jgi:UDP-N-acetylglucosamine--N-acetylmuramyl-(pentapeptide) pyrophosphoryl-undecaprenol N-acetylglucosamine transferase
MAKLIFIGAGGTGGHVLPATQIARELEARGHKVVLVGSGTELDRAQELGFQTRLVTASPPGMNPIKLFKFWRSYMTGARQAGKLIDEMKPSVVIGMGSYASVPLVVTARKKRIPVLIHEQNAVAGRANQLLERFADVIMTGFDDTKKFKKTSKIEVVGNPVRWQKIEPKSKEAYDFLKLDPSKKTILVFGGSRGAKSVYEAFLSLPKEFITQKDLQWLIMTGKLMYENVQKSVSELKLHNVQVIDYLVEMDKAYAVADVSVSRSGAMTVSELECYGIPSILIPKTESMQDHQYLNALYLSKKRKCIVLSEKEAQEKLEAAIRECLKLQRLPSECIHSTAAQNIANIVEVLL